MNVRNSIRRKRAGLPLGDDEIGWLVAAYTNGQIPEYQMSALLMAILWRGMNRNETLSLTRAMIDSGRTLDWSHLEPTADKHSTGGVGDKVSLALAPLAAATGLHVPMISGRGLGHTGGTLDKLESIPGFRTDLDPERFARVLERVGCVMGGQTADLAPADRKIYALRDATETVESIPLIVSSILSKKIAAGPGSIVFDVKVGRGAFMETPEEAEALAEALVSLGTDLGRRVVAITTAMDVPLGRAVGNAIEAREAMAFLRGERVADDLREVTELLTATMLVLARIETSLSGARDRCREALRSGEAWRRFLSLVSAQGGDVAALEADTFHRGVEATLEAPSDGIVSDVDARAVAEIVLDLGGGRRRMEDAVRPEVGVFLDRKPGEPVAKGEPLLTLHLPRGADPAPWLERAARTVEIGDAAAQAPLVRSIFGPEGAVSWSGWETELPLDEG